ncbi:hypothetical protein [Streptomyces sp. NPDC057616]|uniref:hypothetical protein n=1 Tax=Streptomyces sp. NPDC057616 TaxID=3346183 RepID=UPI0036AE0B1B
MAYASVLAVLLIAGAAGAAVALRRARAARGASGLDAEAEAHRLLPHLGAGLAPRGAAGRADADASAGRELTEAAECHRGARALPADARTTAEYERAARLAREGPRHVRAARPEESGVLRGFKGPHSAFPRS